LISSQHFLSSFAAILTELKPIKHQDGVSPESVNSDATTKIDAANINRQAWS